MEGWQATGDHKGEVDKKEVVNNKENGAREGRCAKKKPKEEGGDSEKRGGQRRPEEEKGKIIFKNFHFNFFFNANSTNQIAGYSMVCWFSGKFLATKILALWLVNFDHMIDILQSDWLNLLVLM